MRRFFTPRRLLWYGAAIALMAFLWSARWRVQTVANSLLRPSHRPISADDWWGRTTATSPKQFRTALRELVDVPREGLATLSRKAEQLPRERRLPFLWALVTVGSEEAFAALSLGTADFGTLLHTLGEVDLAAVCAGRKPVTASALRVKRAAAMLLLSDPAVADAIRSCPSGPDPTALDRALAMAVLGKLSPQCAQAVVTHLDDPGWPSQARLRAHAIWGLSGPDAAEALARRVLTLADAGGRALSALALAAGAAEPASRKAASGVLTAGLAAGQALEPELARSVLRDLTRVGQP
ncbi:MAG: hypothetical protein HY814_01400 [Candidatus Riflebacteria bacterium]|nr:hypothetical protein [Candidatus Riflebacteria bacterium]